MKQVVQQLGGGALSIADVPEPIAAPGRVVIANAVSVISAGTEKSVREIARSSLLRKALRRPDQVRQVLEKLRQEGILETVRQVRGRLDAPQALGYSSAGVVVACGAGVQGFRPGDRVASNGPHAGVVSVPKHLCAVVPDGLHLEKAAFGVLGAIALQGVRLARVQLGDTVFVVGLGLVGQLAVALLKSAGCRVVGTDLEAGKCDLALRMGADLAHPGLDGRQMSDLTGGLGADAVLVAAASTSSAPLRLATDAVRKKGRIVVVGAVGMDLPRPPMFEKEAELVVSCSYGPGRYDPLYEDRGIDYPAPYVRWTEQRNLAAVLDQMATGRLDPTPLVSHRFPISEADAAYELIERNAEPYLGILLRYPEEDPAPGRREPIVLGSSPPSREAGIGIGCLGAGNFASGVLLPALQATGRGELRFETLCTVGGLSAAARGERFGFRKATSDEDDLFEDPEVDAIFVLTRHHLHAEQVARGLESGRHVFVEKPLAVDPGQLARIEAALRAEPASSRVLTVGFNRRFSPAARSVRDHFAGISTPLTLSFRFNAGSIPPGEWPQDEEQGGRIIGEACHAIDLLTYLAGSPPVRVFAEAIGGPRAPEITDDQCFITLRHANGSISSVGYLAGGDRAFPKERIEVFGGGRVGVIDDFRELTLVAGGRTRRSRAPTRDKGHRAEVKRFVEAVLDGGPAPIPWAELRAVTLASILAVRSLREGVPFEIPRSDEVPAVPETRLGAEH